MGTRSAFVFPEARWLVREPDGWYMRDYLTESEVFDPIWSTTTQTGLEVSATAGALLMVDFDKWPAALAAPEQPSGWGDLDAAIASMHTRVQICNALALAIHSATVEVQGTSTGGFRVTHEQLMHFHSSGNGFSNSGQLNRVPGHGVLMPRNRHSVCSVEVLERACQTLDDLLQHPDARTLDLFELLNTSVVACRGHDFDLAAVGAWAVCEAVLGSALDEYAHGQAEAHQLSVTVGRRAQWSRLGAATTTEVLALAGVLPTGLDERLSAARKARNAWIHRGEPVGYLAATSSTQLAADLLGRFGWPTVTVAPTVGVEGLGV